VNRAGNKKNKDQKPIYLDPNLQIIFGVTLMSVLGVASITPAFPRIGKELQLSSQSIGLLVTAFTLPGVLLTAVLGILADRWGRKRILVPSLMLFGLAGGACSLARDFDLLLILRFLQGIGGASLGSLNVTIIGDLYRDRERATAMGYNAGILSVGTASYPAIGGALATLGWHYPFVLPLLAIPIGLFVLFALKNPEPKDAQGFRTYLRRAWMSVKNRQVAGLFVASLVTFIILYGAYLTYFPFLIENAFGASPLTTGLIMSWASLTTALTASQLGRLVKVLAKKTLISMAFILYALALAMMPLMPTLWTLLLPTALFGIAHGLNFPSIQTLLAELAPLEHRAAFMSANGMVLRLGQTLGPLLIGVAFGLGGLGIAFYVGAAFSIAMFALASITIG
jgi:ACDE family multidrug resistance protein